MNDFLAYVMAAAVIVSAIAFVLQLILLSQLAKSAKAMQAQTQEFMTKMRPLIDQAMTTIEQGRIQIADISKKANEILDLSKKQLTTIDTVLSKASDCAMVQMERAEMVLDDAMGRVQQTVDLVHGGVMRPVREVSALVAGFRAGMSQFLRGGRTTVERATHDEEMFIG
jgi:hypothetical protein